MRELLPAGSRVMIMEGVMSGRKGIIMKVDGDSYLYDVRIDDLDPDPWSGVRTFFAECVEREPSHDAP